MRKQRMYLPNYDDLNASNRLIHSDLIGQPKFGIYNDVALYGDSNGSGMAHSFRNYPTDLSQWKGPMEDVRVVHLMVPTVPQINIHIMSCLF